MPVKQTPSQTWMPPEGYSRVDSKLPDVSVYAPEPKSVDKDQAKAYACPNCGANIAYDVSAGGIACEYCGYIAPVKAMQVGKSADEFEFTLETISQSNRGWGIKRQVLHCESCGGELSIPEGTLSTTCPFCASNQVNVTTSLEESLRPRFLIPFKVTRDQNLRLVRDWLGKGWFHPNELAVNTLVKRFVGIYLPFWTFDTKVDAHWRAQVGYQKTVRHYNAHTKRWESRTKIVWRWKDGNVRLTIDDFLVTGSSNRHISHRILERIYPYQMNGLVDYHPDFLAGWQAQAYERTLVEAWESGKRAVRERAKKACYQDIPTNRVRNFSMTADFKDESWRYVLLPVYLSSYRYEDQIYQVMVNGQTGTVAGQKPVAWWKIWLAIAAILAPGIFLGLMGVPLLLAGGLGVIFIAMGIILFVIGLIISFILYNNARQSEAK